MITFSMSRQSSTAQRRDNAAAVAAGLQADASPAGAREKQKPLPLPSDARRSSKLNPA
jgi:hypothetical protein